MIHDPEIEVTCDGIGCGKSLFYCPEYVYSTHSGNNGRYKDDDEEIEEWLADDEGWIVRDGKHFCCEACANAKPLKPRKGK